jgi:hypothetical protein
MDILDYIGPAIPILIYGSLIVGSIYQLLKILISQIRVYKSSLPENRKFGQKAKIALAFFGILYGCTPIFLIIHRILSDVSGFRLPKLVAMILALSYVPFFAVVYCLGIGIGLGSGYSGISATNMYNDLDINLTKKEKSS